MNMHRVLKVRASLALLFVLCLILFCSQPSFADNNPPARAARISYLKGKVSFQPAGTDQWSEATLNFTVTTEDRLFTDKGARAELEVGPYTVRLAEQTDLIVTNLNDQLVITEALKLLFRKDDDFRRWADQHTNNHNNEQVNGDVFAKTV